MKEKFYVGISISHNSSACVVSTTRGLLTAISQERLNGEKNTKELPFYAILRCLSANNVTKVERVIVSHYEEITVDYLVKHTDRDLIGDTWQEVFLNFFKQENIEVVKGISRVDHHTAHLYSPFGFYGLPDKNSHYYMVSSDGFGDGSSGKIIENIDGVLSVVPLKNSLSLVYQFVTGALGFKELRHEGKITGLAAYGKPIYVKEFEDLYDKVVTGNLLNFKEHGVKMIDLLDYNNNIIDFDKYLDVKRTIYDLVEDITYHGGTREDIAASVQEFVEKHTLAWLEHYCIDKYDVYLSGGLFANVKINQRIKDSGLFKEVYVCPAMGDEGTCVGSVIYSILVNEKEYNLSVDRANDKVISGLKTSKFEFAFFRLHKYLKEHNLKDKYELILKDSVLERVNYISENLANDKIVCLMRGNFEFGPRALCHRSILYNATKKETNDSLNARLSRSEFMPFAPVCKEEYANDLFKNLDGGRESGKFMTMTFDGTDEFVNTYKAVAHVDGTARPQIVKFKDDQYMWLILDSYFGRTGLKCLVNTSFNLHEQPIISDEITAIESFVKADLDLLVVENIIIKKK